MELKEKLELLLKEIDCNISYFSQKHLYTKRRATILRNFSIIFSAFITVILGLDITGITNLLKSIAIILGALVTILNTTDAFYNYSALWVKNTLTLAKLKELKREIMFYGAGCQAKDISENKLNKYMNEFQKILKDDIKQWTRIRERAVNMEQEKEDTALTNIKYRGSLNKDKDKDIQE